MVWSTFADPGNVVDAGGGRIAFSIKPGPTASSAIVDAVAAHNLSGSGMGLELVSAGDQTQPHFGVSFGIKDPDSNELSFRITGGLIEAVDIVTVRAQMPYDAGIRFFRFREQSGVVHWEVSAGCAYTELFSELSPLSSASVIGSFGALRSTGSPGGTTSTAIFDNFDVNDPP